MNIVDILIALILVAAAITGWRAGFVKEIFSFAGFFLGLFLANLLYRQVGYLLAPHIEADPSTLYIIAFILIWIGVPVALWILGSILTGFLKLISLGSLNSSLGCIVNIAKNFVLLGLIANVLVITKLAEKPIFTESVLFKTTVTTTAPIFEFAKKQWNHQ